MADASRDANRVPTLLGVSTVDSKTPTAAKVDPSTGRLLVDTTIEAADIEIGAVEIKNATDDTRATVDADGLNVSVKKSVLPANAAQETGGNLDLIKAKTDNLDVALSTRLKPADTLTKVATVDTITNAVTVVQSTNANLKADVTSNAQNIATQTTVAAINTVQTDGTQKTKLTDVYGFGVENTPMDEIRTVTPFRLVGATFTGTTLDTNFWTASLGTGGTAVQGNAQVILSTGATANNATAIQSTRMARYVGASANRFRCVLRLPDTGTANNVRQWGAFSTTDGAFFQLSGTTLNIVTRKTSSDTAVAAASWNGTTFTMDTNVHTYEIYWTNSSVWFVIDGVLRHKVSAATTTWADTMNLPVRFDNTNSGGSTTNVAMNMRTATISRLGSPSTQPVSKFQSGTTAGVICKYGSGNLHGLVISNVTNSAVVTLYDNTAASGTVLWASGTMGAQTQPFALEMHDIPFSTGLTLVISGANADCFVAYE